MNKGIHFLVWIFVLNAFVCAASFAGALDPDLVPKETEIPIACFEAREHISNKLGLPLSSANSFTETEWRLFANKQFDDYNPFKFYNTPHLKTAEWVTRFILETSLKRFFQKDPDLKDFRSTLKSLIGHFANIEMEQKKQSTLRSHQFINQFVRNAENNAIEMLPLYCLSNTSLLECKTTIQFFKVFNQMYKQEGNLYIAMPAVERYYTDWRWISGLARFNRLALEKLMKITLTPSDPTLIPSDVLSDLTSAYLEVGMSPSDAVDAAMLILGVYSTRGASFLDSTISGADTHLLNLVVFSGMISVLDAWQFLKLKKSYFLPKNINLNCAYGKPYHFWMGAYLSHVAVKNNINYDTSADINQLFAVAYEMSRGDQNLKLPLFHPQINMSRMDLFFRTAGIFAFNKNHLPNDFKNLDETLYKIFVSSGTLPSTTESLIRILFAKNNPDQAVLWWKQVRPDVIKASFQKVVQ